ncbi:HEAT repeat domain-containing protein [Kribbella sp. NPDC054772]
MQQSRRVVLKESASSREVLALAAAFRWDFVGEQLPDPDRGVGYSATWTGADGTTLHYLEDQVSGFRYVVLQSPASRVLEALLETLDETEYVWGLDELVEEFDAADNPKELATAVLRLGAGAPDEYTAEIASRISGALAHADPSVRDHALWAVAYSSYPAYLPALRQLAEEDPELRERALATVTAITAQGT